MASDKPPRYAMTHIDEIERLPAFGMDSVWRPVRHHFGIEAFGINAYTASNDSGQVSLKIPGEGGAGTIDGGALEASTVDLSTEFTSLITTQRAYSASSKIITTADQMMQELLDTIR